MLWATQFGPAVDNSVGWSCSCASEGERQLARAVATRQCWRTQAGMRASAGERWWVLHGAGSTSKRRARGPEQASAGELHWGFRTEKQKERSKE